MKAKKILSALLAALLLISSLSLCAYAEEDGEREVYEWDATTDGNMVWNDDREYYLYEIPFGYKVDFRRSYFFDGEVDINGDEFSITSYARDGEIIEIENNYLYDYYWTYYVTDAGRESIEALVGGSYTSVRLHNYGEVSDLDSATLTALDSLNTGAEVQVTDLEDLNFYEIRMYNSTDSVYYVYGALYEYNGGMWYLNYDRLSNDHFDADGNFSYRRGSVTMYQVDGAPVYSTIIEAEENFYYFYEDAEFEVGFFDNVDVDGVVIAKIGFWAVFVIIGIALPVWTLVIGIKNSRSAKHARGRHWLAMAFASVAWILIAIAVALIIIIG